MAVTIINVILFTDCNTYSVVSTKNSESKISYTEMKEHERELKEYITQLKDERADKEAYLASLDNDVIELKSQCNKLLEQKKRISDELDLLNANNF